MLGTACPQVIRFVNIVPGPAPTFVNQGLVVLGLQACGLRSVAGHTRKPYERLPFGLSLLGTPVAPQYPQEDRV